MYALPFAYFAPFCGYINNGPIKHQARFLFSGIKQCAFSYLKPFSSMQSVSRSLRYGTSMSPSIWSHPIPFICSTKRIFTWVFSSVVFAKRLLLPSFLPLLKGITLFFAKLPQDLGPDILLIRPFVDPLALFAPYLG